MAAEQLEDMLEAADSGGDEDNPPPQKKLKASRWKAAHKVALLRELDDRETNPFMIPANRERTGRWSTIAQRIRLLKKVKYRTDDGERIVQTPDWDLFGLDGEKCRDVFKAMRTGYTKRVGAEATVKRSAVPSRGGGDSNGEDSELRSLTKKVVLMVEAMEEERSKMAVKGKHFAGPSIRVEREAKDSEEIDVTTTAPMDAPQVLAAEVPHVSPRPDTTSVTSQTERNDSSNTAKHRSQGSSHMASHGTGGGSGSKVGGSMNVHVSSGGVGLSTRHDRVYGSGVGASPAWGAGARQVGESEAGVWGGVGSGSDAYHPPPFRQDNRLMANEIGGRVLGSGTRVGPGAGMSMWPGQGAGVGPRGRGNDLRRGSGNLAPLDVVSLMQEAVTKGGSGTGECGESQDPGQQHTMQQPSLNEQMMQLLDHLSLQLQGVVFQQGRQAHQMQVQGQLLLKFQDQMKQLTGMVEEQREALASMLQHLSEKGS